MSMCPCQDVLGWLPERSVGTFIMAAMQFSTSCLLFGSVSRMLACLLACFSRQILTFSFPSLFPLPSSFTPSLPPFFIFFLGGGVRVRTVPQDGLSLTMFLLYSLFRWNYRSELPYLAQLGLLVILFSFPWKEHPRYTLFPTDLPRPHKDKQCQPGFFTDNSLYMWSWN